MRRVSPLLLLPALSLPALAQLPPAGAVPVLSGRFYESERSQPIAGALVVLYEKGTGLLIDSTYTRDTGDFTLRAPPRAGAFYLVATKGDVSRREDLGFDPAHPAMDVSIAYRPSFAWWARLGKYFYGQFGALAGFLLGWLFNRWIGRRDAHRKAETVLRVYLIELRAEVDRAAALYKSYWDRWPADKRLVSIDACRNTAKSVVPAHDAIKRQLEGKPIEDDLYEVCGEAGVADLVAFRRRLREIEALVEPEVGALTGGQVAQLVTALHEGLRALQHEPLLQR